MALNILLAGSLSLLWGLINSLQYVTNFPLLNVAYPENAKMWYDCMYQIASF
jgi:FMN-dependent NADH-azoreductase